VAGASVSPLRANLAEARSRRRSAPVRVRPRERRLSLRVHVHLHVRGGCGVPSRVKVGTLARKQTDCAPVRHSRRSSRFTLRSDTVSPTMLRHDLHWITLISIE